MWRTRRLGCRSPHLRCSVYPIPPRNWGTMLHDSFPGVPGCGLSGRRQGHSLDLSSPLMEQFHLDCSAGHYQWPEDMGHVFRLSTFGARPEPTSPAQFVEETQLIPCASC